MRSLSNNQNSGKSTITHPTDLATSSSTHAKAPTYPHANQSYGKSAAPSTPNWTEWEFWSKPTIQIAVAPPANCEYRKKLHDTKKND